MTKEPDGEGGPATGSAPENHPLQDAVPPARASAANLGEPPARPSAAQLAPGPENYPDDGPVAGALRKVDHIVGTIEQVVLVSLLALIIGVGAVQAVATKAFQHSFLWSFDVVRGGTFVIAMLGAAYASHHASHFAMDIVSRYVQPRARLAIQVGLGLFTIFASYLLMDSGLRIRAQVASEGGSHTIPPDLIAAMIPVGAALIIFHTLMRVGICTDYLRRGKLLPEKAPSAH